MKFVHCKLACLRTGRQTEDTGFCYLNGNLHQRTNIDIKYCSILDRLTEEWSHLIYEDGCSSLLDVHT